MRFQKAIEHQITLEDCEDTKGMVPDLQVVYSLVRGSHNVWEEQRAVEMHQREISLLPGLTMEVMEKVVSKAGAPARCIS